MIIKDTITSCNNQDVIDIFKNYILKDRDLKIYAGLLVSIDGKEATHYTTLYEDNNYKVDSFWDFDLNKNFDMCVINKIDIKSKNRDEYYEVISSYQSNLIIESLRFELDECQLLNSWGERAIIESLEHIKDNLY